MTVLIDNKSSLPIYDQIYSQIKAQIISGELQEHEALPSIRNLAKDLRISVITTKRAYDELEKEGFIYTIAAKGCFVAPKNVELLREVFPLLFFAESTRPFGRVLSVSRQKKGPAGLSEACREDGVSNRCCFALALVGSGCRTPCRARRRT